MLRSDFKPYRNELIISTKAGWDMWPGPYGQLGWREPICSPALTSRSTASGSTTSTSSTRTGSIRRHLSTRRSARSTPRCVRERRAMSASRPTRPARHAEAAAIAQRLGTPLVIHQPSYSLLNRWIEGGLTDELANAGMGAIAFTALAQGLLTDRYLQRAAADIDRATTRPTFDDELVTERSANGFADSPVSPNAVASRWRSLRWPGCSASPRWPPRSSARRASPSSTRIWAPLRIWTSHRMNSAKSTSTLQIPVSICGERAPMYSRTNQHTIAVNY